MIPTLNFLPLSTRREYRFWLRLRQWSAVWIVVVALSLVAAVVQTSLVAEQHYQLSVLQTKVEPLRSLQREHEQYQQRLTLLESRESLLVMLERIEQPVQLLGIIGRSIGDERPEVQVYELELSPTQVVEVVKAAAGPPPGAPTGPTGNTPPATTTRTVDRVHLRLAGLGADDLAVARFVAGLREAGVFESVALKSSVHTAALSGECRQFTVECVFQ